MLQGQIIRMLCVVSAAVFVTACTPTPENYSSSGPQRTGEPNGYGNYAEHPLSDGFTPEEEGATEGGTTASGSTTDGGTTGGGTTGGASDVCQPLLQDCGP
jgi:hypothetical protein